MHELAGRDEPIEEWEEYVIGKVRNEDRILIRSGSARRYTQTVQMSKFLRDYLSHTVSYVIVRDNVTGEESACMEYDIGKEWTIMYELSG